MSDWSHRDVTRLLQDVDRLEPIDPAESIHPSKDELDAHVQERLSPFVLESFEAHIEVCEQCTGYLAQAFEHGLEEAPPRRSVGLPWVSALAASWALPLLGTAWILSQALAVPVAIDTGPRWAGPSGPTEFLQTTFQAAAYQPVLDETALSRSLSKTLMEDWQRFQTSLPTSAEVSSSGSQDHLDLLSGLLDQKTDTMEARLEARLLAALGPMLQSTVEQALAARGPNLTGPTTGLAAYTQCEAPPSPSQKSKTAGKRPEYFGANAR